MAPRSASVAKPSLRLVINPSDPPRDGA